MSARTINVNSNVAIDTFGAGGIDLNADRNITLNSGSSLTTVDGGITLNAAGMLPAVSPPNGDNFVGLLGNNMTVQTTGDGDISLTGTGGDFTSPSNINSGSQNGIRFDNSSMSSTKTGGNAGTITLDGTGGPSARARNNGVILVNTTATIVDGDFLITGRGGGTSGTAGNNRGVALENSALESTGVGADAAQITIDGTGGNSGGSSNHGVSFDSADVTSTDGDISISGNATATLGTAVFLSSGDTIESFGIGNDASNVTIQGTGGVALAGNITTVDGDISITGEQQAGGTAGVAAASVLVSSTGVGPGAGNVTIHGTGGSGSGTQKYGVHMVSPIATLIPEITSVDGDILLVGQGGGTGGSDNMGLKLEGIISSTGVGADAATITLNGTGGVGSTFNHGVHLNGSRSNVSSVEGQISINGEGGTGAGNGTGSGVMISHEAALEVTGALATIAGIGGGTHQVSLGYTNGPLGHLRSVGSGEIHVHAAGSFRG